MRLILTSVLILAVIVSLCPAKSIDLSSAQIYRSQGDYIKAIEFYNKAIEEYQLKLEELKAKYPDEKTYTKKTKKDIKELGTAYYEIGDCYKQQGNYQKMTDSFNNSLDYYDKYENDIYSTREELWVKFYNDGVPLFNDKEYEKAVSLFNTAVIIDPENPDGYRERGMCFLQLARAETDSVKRDELMEKAAADFDVVIARDEDGTEIAVRVNKANMYYQSGNFEKAIPAYKKVLEVEPDNLAAVSKMALIYQGQGNNDEAVNMYNYILKSRSDDPDLWFNLGVLYFNMENFEEARKAFDNVLEINPDDIETCMNIISSLFQTEHYGEAIPYLEKAKEINPGDVRVWQFLTVSYQKEIAREGIDETLQREYIEKANEAYKKYKALSGE